MVLRPYYDGVYCWRLAVVLTIKPDFDHFSDFKLCEGGTRSNHPCSLSKTSAPLHFVKLFIKNPSGPPSEYGDHSRQNNSRYVRPFRLLAGNVPVMLEPIPYQTRELSWRDWIVTIVGLLCWLGGFFILYHGRYVTSRFVKTDFGFFLPNIEIHQNGVNPCAELVPVDTSNGVKWYSPLSHVDACPL